ncbi:MAG: fibronectin type III domain-containing protein, partial [Desulfobacteraceae bacterium]|nr:fibronectin type III domain-containing protein [Desulfobacteraceae bacterium]
TDLPETITDQTSAKITVGTPQGSPEIEEYYYSMDEGVTWNYGKAGEPIELDGLAEGKHTLFVNGFGNNVWQDGADGMTIENATSYEWRVDLTPADAAELDTAKGEPSSSTVRLSWRWASDDDRESIQKYLVWYSDEEITQENLENATPVFCGIMPGTAGDGESFTIDKLAAGQKYYFAVKSVDAAGNVSPLSNVAEYTTESMLPEITGIVLVDGGNSGDNAVARDIRITGANFLESAGCNLARFENETHVFDVSCNGGTRTRISATIPEGAPTGAYDLRVINKNGISRLFENAYTVIEAATPVPEVTNLSP